MPITYFDKQENAYKLLIQQAQKLFKAEQKYLVNDTYKCDFFLTPDKQLFNASSVVVTQSNSELKVDCKGWKAKGKQEAAFTILFTDVSSQSKLAKSLYAYNVSASYRGVKSSFEQGLRLFSSTSCVYYAMYMSVYETQYKNYPERSHAITASSTNTYVKYLDAPTNDKLTVKNGSHLEVLSVTNTGRNEVNIEEGGKFSLRTLAGKTNFSPPNPVQQFKESGFRKDFDVKISNPFLFYMRGSDLVVVDQYDPANAYIIKNYEKLKPGQLDITDFELSKNLLFFANPRKKQEIKVSNESERGYCSTQKTDKHYYVAENLYVPNSVRQFAIMYEEKLGDVTPGKNDNYVVRRIYDLDKDKMVDCLLLKGVVSFQEKWQELAAKHDKLTVVTRTKDQYWRFQTLKTKS